MMRRTAWRRLWCDGNYRFNIREEYLLQPNTRGRPSDLCWAHYNRKSWLLICSCGEQNATVTAHVSQRKAWEIFPQTADYASARSASSHSHPAVSLFLSNISGNPSLILWRTLGKCGPGQTDVAYQAFSECRPCFCTVIWWIRSPSGSKEPAGPLFLWLTEADSWG